MFSHVVDLAARMPLLPEQQGRLNVYFILSPLLDLENHPLYEICPSIDMLRYRPHSLYMMFQVDSQLHQLPT